MNFRGATLDGNTRDTTRLGLIFNIQDFSVQDGPGIRTVVFLKGCLLRCRWCANPEGQEFYPEIMFSRTLCSGCKKCASSCPNSTVLIDEDGYPVFYRELCRNCLKTQCWEVCNTGAIKIAGKFWSAEALYKRVKTNSLFYRNSGGGVTLSGGEPFAQPEFVREFLEQCEKTGISVGAETCGLFGWNKVRNFIGKIDFFFFDIKCLDAKQHKFFTGSGNEIILENLKHLAEIEPTKLVVNITIVRSVNDSEEMLISTTELCKKNNISKLRLLPCHSLGKEKYLELGRSYVPGRNFDVDRSELERFKEIIISRGIDCWIE